MKLRTDLILRHLGNEYIVVDPGQDMVDMSKVFTLNEVAAFLWRELQGKEFTEEAILRLLLANYDVGVDQARADAQKLVSDFREQGLLTD
jgi:hypothetical protein